MGVPLNKKVGVQYCATRINRNAVRGGTIRPSPRQLCIANWNVEVLTETKRITLQSYMQDYAIHLWCLREVRKSMSEYYITEAVLFLLICSGGEKS